MEPATERPTVVVDGYTRLCLTVIAVLLTVLIIGLWGAGPIKPSHGLAAPPRPAERDATGIGNPAEQRMAMVRAIGQTNDKLDEIIRLLKDGKIKVVVAEGEAKHAPAKLR